MNSTRAMGGVLVRLGIAAVAMFALWQLATPDFDHGARPHAGENAAIATLQNVYAAERQFLALRAVDRDGDGRGEAGWFDELAGAVPLRMAADATGPAANLAVPLLPQAFARPARGRVRRCGYWFQLWLPADGGRWVAQGDGAADASEQEFRVCAWPDGSDGSCRRAFVLDGQGTVWAAANDGGRYCANSRPLPPDAAEPEADAAGDAGEGRTGRDGQTWAPLR